MEWPCFGFLQEGEVDLIAMDMQMPILDGVETTRKIRAMEIGAGGHVPIMAMTANAFEEDRRKCFRKPAWTDSWSSRSAHNPFGRRWSAYSRSRCDKQGKMLWSGRIPEAGLSLACLQRNGPGVTQGLPGAAAYRF